MRLNDFKGLERLYNKRDELAGYADEQDLADLTAVVEALRKYEAEVKEQMDSYKA